ncbi:MAG: peptide MFS transporter [Flavobacteriaceae bacterium]
MTTETQPEATLLGHPKGLFYLFFAELWERFSFYGMRALLTLYMVNVIFEALATRDIAAAAVYASYGSLVYASTVIGGRISDTLLGFRKSILLGGSLMALGHFVLAIENNFMFYLALGLIVVGNGFFKPNISTFVAALYKENDPRKDSGFVIFYMGINIGGFVAPLLCGWLGAAYGWHYGFGLAGIGMLTGLAFFWKGIKAGVFKNEGLPPSEEKLNKKVGILTNNHWVTLLAFLSAPAIAFMLSSYEAIAGGTTYFGDQNLVNVLFKGIGFVVAAYLAYILFNATVEERKKLTVAIFITVFMTLFWGFHELSGSVITLFADRNVDLTLMNASQTNSLNSMFIILLSIPISWLFTYLSKKNLNPRTPYKFGIGLLLAGISFYILKLSGESANAEGLVPFAFLLIMYFLISVGELFMSPVGLSKITDLSPKRIVAFMMGIWFLSSSYAFQLVGFIGKELAVESTENQVNSLVSLPIYIEGFSIISNYALGAGVIVLLLAPFLNKLMGDVH